jgi:hypothetical protein
MRACGLARVLVARPKSAAGRALSALDLAIRLEMEEEPCRYIARSVRPSYVMTSASAGPFRSGRRLQSWKDRADRSPERAIARQRHRSSRVSSGCQCYRGRWPGRGWDGDHDRCGKLSTASGHRPRSVKMACCGPAIASRMPREATRHRRNVRDLPIAAQAWRIVSQSPVSMRC